MNFISSLLTDSTTTETPTSNNVLMYVFLGVILVAIIVMFIFTSRKNKKKEQEQKDMLDAVAPGNKVTTIGGISGVVVEVDPSDDTFVLETGSEDSGKSYIKFLKQAIYQTDAKPVATVKTEAKPEEKEEVKPVEAAEEKPEVKEEEKAEPAVEEKTEEPAPEEKADGESDK